MYIDEFPGCCKIKVFTGMDNHEDNDALEDDEAPDTAIDVFHYLCSEWNPASNMDMHNLRTYKLFITAATLDEQYEANHAFRVMGWKHTPWKKNDSGRKIRMWWIHGGDLADFMKKASEMPREELTRLFHRKPKKGEYTYPGREDEEDFDDSYF